MEVPVMRFKRGFFFILLPHANLMITGSQIQLGKEGCASQLIK
jgi:hypothetical protein